MRSLDIQNLLFPASLFEILVFALHPVLLRRPPSHTAHSVTHVLTIVPVGALLVRVVGWRRHCALGLPRVAGRTCVLGVLGVGGGAAERLGSCPLVALVSLRPAWKVVALPGRRDEPKPKPDP